MSKLKSGLIAICVTSMLFAGVLFAVLLTTRHKKQADAPLATPIKPVASQAGALSWKEVDRRFLGAGMEEVRTSLGAPDHVYVPSTFAADASLITGQPVFTEPTTWWSYSHFTVIFDKNNRVQKVLDGPSAR
jgi:hypothetical protein